MASSGAELRKPGGAAMQLQNSRHAYNPGNFIFTPQLVSI